METEVTEQEPHDFAECQLAMIPMADVLQQIGGKWTIFIIGELGQGPRRFGELKRRIEGVSQKMLTATLRDLEKDGFVTRTGDPKHPAARRLRTDRYGARAAQAAAGDRAVGHGQPRPGHRGAPAL